jgi:hypothetical protein
MLCQTSLSRVTLLSSAPVLRGPLPRSREGNEESRIILIAIAWCALRRMIAVTSRRVPVLEATSGVSGGLVTSLQQGSSASGARR